MKVNKKLTTVTPLSKFLALLLFILLPLGAFFFGLDLKNKGVTLNSQDSTSIGKPVESPEKKYQLIKEYGKVFFIDDQYGYTLDLSNLPEVEMTTSDFDQEYVFEMYPKVEVFRKAPTIVSVARFGISAIHENSQNLELEEIAKDKYDYSEGELSPGFTKVEKLRKITTAQKYNAIFWDSELSVEGASNQRDYLIDLNGRYVHIQVYAWNQKNFDRAVADFEKILSSFKVE